MSLSATALVTLNQARNFIQSNPASTQIVSAEYVGMGDGGTKVFTLDHTPVSGSLQLYVNGTLKVQDTDFTLSTATITFGTAPTLNHPITASYVYTATSDSFEDMEDDLIEFLINAATKKAEDYTGRAFVQRSHTDYINGDGTDTLRLQRLPITTITSVSYRRVVGKTGDGSTTAFSLGYTPKANSLTVYLDGTLQSSGYTLSSNTVTFDTAPTDGQKIVFRFEVSLDLSDDYSEQLNNGRLIGSWLEDYEYIVVYTAGYASTRAATQALVPDAVMAVLSAVKIWYENRMGLTSESITGLSSTDYGDIEELPEVSKKFLSSLNRNLI